MDENPLVAIAQQYEQAAQELEQAAAHLRVTSRHFRDREVPRGCAHAFAAQGHIYNAQLTITELAILHASKSNLP